MDTAKVKVFIPPVPEIIVIGVVGEVANTKGIGSRRGSGTVPFERILV